MQAWPALSLKPRVIITKSTPQEKAAHAPSDNTQGNESSKRLKQGTAWKSSRLWGAEHALVPLWSREPPRLAYSKPEHGKLRLSHTCPNKEMWCKTTSMISISCDTRHSFRVFVFEAGSPSIAWVNNLGLTTQSPRQFQVDSIPPSAWQVLGFRLEPPHSASSWQQCQVWLSPKGSLLLADLRHLALRFLYILGDK